MQESPLFSRTYDLLLWLIPQVQKFPRAHRFGLGERLVHRALDFQEALLAAGKSKGDQRRQQLQQADLHLEQVRLWMRLACELECLSVRQYEHASRLLTEVGRLLGAWIRQLNMG